MLDCIGRPFHPDSGILRVFDFAPWLSPLDGDNPSGIDLRNDPRFHELERLMQPQVEILRDERNNPVSQTEVPVDWSEVLRKAEALRAQGRDLRLLVIVARALANDRGLAGLADGLGLIARTVEDHWDTLHPELRAGAAPREAALRRINALVQLQNDQDGLLRDLRGAVFFAPRGIGPITGRELERGTLDTRTLLGESASGLNDAERAALAGAHELSLNRVRSGCAAYADQSGAEMAALRDGGRAAFAALKALETALDAKLGGGSGAALPDLGRFLTRMTATLERAAAPPVPAKAGLPVDRPGPGLADTALVEAAGGFPERLASRDEVVTCLDLIIGFYDRTEPSSPIPHLARRVRRMVPMDFLELMEDLAPAGLKEFRTLAGMPDDKKNVPRKGETQ